MQRHDRANHFRPHHKIVQSGSLMLLRCLKLSLNNMSIAQQRAGLWVVSIHVLACAALPQHLDGHSFTPATFGP